MLMWALFLFVLFGSCQHICALNLVTVNTAYGAVQGFTTNYAKIFYGIPFAKPPVGSLRWSAPASPNSWFPWTRDATVAPPACMQSACNSNDSQCVASMSEDCLYLNIFAPLKTSASPLPVMIFIHGGCLFQGGMSIAGFQSDRLVNTTNVVLVFMQYRLGILGFLASGPRWWGGVSGNFGLLDQQMAIKWVYANINAFGGDPNKITLFGESAGAQSVAIHYASPSMQTYFKGAILQSPPMVLPFKQPTDYSGIFDAIVSQFTCQFTLTPMDCLRAVPAASLNTIPFTGYLAAALNALQSPLSSSEPWNPVIDGSIITDSLSNMLTKSSLPLKPLMYGTNGKEMLGILYMLATGPVPLPAYGALLGVMFGGNTNTVYNQLPGITNVNPDDQRPVISKLLTEYMFSCPARVVMRNANTAATYGYVFNYPLHTYGVLNFPICEGQPCHGYEMAFLFQSMWSNMTATEKIISQNMATYWTNFAKSQDPNLPGPVPLAWPKLTAAAENYMTFDSTFSITNNYLKSDCDVLDSVGYNTNWFSG